MLFLSLSQEIHALFLPATLSVPFPDVATAGRFSDQVINCIELSSYMVSFG